MVEEYIEVDVNRNVTIPASSSVTETLSWQTGTDLRGYYTLRASTDTQETNAKTTQRIWISPLATTTVDDFEDQDFAEYNGQTASWTTSSTAAIEGTYHADGTDTSGAELAIVSETGLAAYPAEAGTLTGRVRHEDSTSSVGLCTNATYSSGNITAYVGEVNFNTGKLILSRYNSASETGMSAGRTQLTERLISVSPQTYYWMEMKPVNSSGELELLLYEYDSSTDTRENLISRIKYTDGSANALTATDTGIGIYQRSDSTGAYIDYLQAE